MDTTKYYLLIADIYKEVQENRIITSEQVNQFKELWQNASDIEYNETLAADALMEHIIKVLDTFEEDNETVKECLGDILDVVVLSFADINKDYYITLFDFTKSYNSTNDTFSNKIDIAEQLMAYNHSNVFVQVRLCVILLGWYIIDPKTYFINIQDLSTKLKSILPIKETLNTETHLYSTIFPQ